MFLALLIIFGSILIIVGIGALILILSGDLIMFVCVTGASAFLISFLCSRYFRDKYILARKIQTVCEIIFAIAIVNFITFLIISLIIGGSAPNGKITGEHYYLGDHGYYKEVSFVIYFYSLIHAYSLFITHPLGMLAGWIDFSTGGNIGTFPNLQKMFPSKRNKSNNKNQLPKSNY